MTEKRTVLVTGGAGFVGSNLALGYADWARSMTTVEARRVEQQNYHNVFIAPASYAAYVASSIFPVGLK